MFENGTILDFVQGAIRANLDVNSSINIGEVTSPASHVNILWKKIEVLQLRMDICPCRMAPYSTEHKGNNIV